MAKVKKGCVILRVDDKDAEYYVKLGYNILDENGDVLKAAMPSDTPTLQKFYREGHEEIARLNARVAELEAQVREAETKSDASAKKVTKSAKSKTES